MSDKAAITVLRGREEVERLWRSADYPKENVEKANAAVTFIDAPGDRGTEIHVHLDRGASNGTVPRIVQRLTGPARLAKIKDELRKFKQLVETGEIARSEATPEGESLMRKFKQRPAQHLDGRELEKVGQ